MSTRTRALGSAWLIVMSLLMSYGCAERSGPPEARVLASKTQERAGAELSSAPHHPRLPVPRAEESPAVPVSTTAGEAPSPQPESSNAVMLPPLLGPDGQPLPQTDQRPDDHSESLAHRVSLLCDAIRLDQPELARPAFFPLVAYQQVKAVARPERDFRLRLWTAFERDVHGYHRQLGRGAEQAICGALEIPEGRARLMKPGSEGNRLFYHRVLRSRLAMTDARGKVHDFEVTSLIAWRGEWYVVHLDGFE